VNYITLSTAQSLSRAKEVGLRKATGAKRIHLFFQFMLETILIHLVALFASLVLFEVLLQPFGSLTDMPVNTNAFLRPWVWKISGILFISGIVLSGSYPVLFLTSFDPADILKRKIRSVPRGIKTRKVLVVNQFVMAIGLLAFSISVYKQLMFMHRKELGFSVEQKLVVKLPRVRPEGFEGAVGAFRNTLLSDPSIHKMCVGTEVPGRQIYWDAGAIKRAGSDENKNYRILGVDYDYIDLFQLEMAAGRNFSKDFPSDSNALILNERAVGWMGFEDAESALGEQVDYWGITYRIIGVLKNYHQESVKQHFVPQIFRLMPTGRDVRGYFIFEISGTGLTGIISTIETTYDKFFPDNPFEYFFLDDYYNLQYKPDELFGKIIGLFSILAIFITCLGVFGMAVFVAMKRVKEIGIRKVNGANSSDILVLLIKEIVIWVMISLLIAGPAAWYITTLWLRNFAYKTSLDWWIYVSAGVIVFGIALLTVSWQSLRAAQKNPVDVLRYE
jgi:putative ABC transport system permease protein